MKEKIKKLLNLKYFEFIEYFYQEGECRFCLITGQNASGKSLVRKILHQMYSEEKIEFINISMENRAGSGLEHLLIYGSEEGDSSGFNSVKTFRKLVQTSKGREGRHVIFLDEPDLGLSDEYASGMGVKIVEFVKNLGENCLGIYLVTHNRFLVEQILCLSSHYLRIGDRMSLVEWLGRKVEVLDLDELEKRGKETWHKIQEVINERKNK